MCIQEAGGTRSGWVFATETTTLRLTTTLSSRQRTDATS